MMSKRVIGRCSALSTITRAGMHRAATDTRRTNELRLVFLLTRFPGKEIDSFLIPGTLRRFERETANSVQRELIDIGLVTCKFYCGVFSQMKDHANRVRISRLLTGALQD